MATNAVTYIKNLGKSVSYSAVDKFKKMAPTTVDFVTTNQELFKETYSTIKNYRQTYRRIGNYIKKSKVYEAAEYGSKSLLEDIATGKWYNKERIAEAEVKFSGGMADGGDMDIDMSMNDDFDSSDDGWDGTDGDKLVSESVQIAGQESAKAISMSVAKSSQYIVENQRATTNLLYAQNERMTSILQGGFGAINDGINKVMNFSTEVIQNHAKMSAEFYQASVKLDEERNKILKEMLELQKKNTGNTEKKVSSSDKITYDDIINSSGVLDIKAYAKNVKKNLKNTLDGMGGGMLSAFGDDSNMLAMLAASPMKFIIDGLVNKMVTKNVEKAAENLDKTVSGFFGSLIAKINNMKGSDNPLWQSIGKIFGINIGEKKDIDTAKYEKGAIPFDGVTKKAIIEVIPGYLAQMVSLMSGKSAKIFDYETGKYTNMDTIEKNYKNKNKSYRDSAMGDLKEELLTAMDNAPGLYKNMNEFIELQENMEKFLDAYYKKGFFDFNPKNISKALEEMDGVYDPEGKLAGLLGAVSRQTKMTTSGKIASAKGSMTRYYETEEAKGISSLTNLFNKSDMFEGFKNVGKYNQVGGMLVSTIDEAGKNIFYYLRNMYKEISYTRLLIAEGGFGGPITTTTTSDGKTTTRRRKSKLPKFDAYSPDVLKSEFKDPDKISDSKKESFNNKVQKDIEKSRKAGYSIIDIIDDENMSEAQKARYITAMIKTNSLTSELKKLNEEDRERAKSFIEKFKNKELKDENGKDKYEGNFIEKLLQAETISSKFAVITDSLQSISRKPMEIIEGLFTKVDQRLFEVIYGMDTKNYRGKEAKGFLDILIIETQYRFGQLNEWINETLLTPLKEKLGVEQFRELPSKILEAFGIDTVELKTQMKEFLFGDEKKNKRGVLSDIKDSIKNTFSGAWDYVKESLAYTFPGAANWLKDKKEKYQQRKKERAEKAKREELENKIQEASEDISVFEAGTRYVPRTGITAISEGEMIIPAHLNPFNPNRDKVNRSKNRRDEKKAKKNFANSLLGGLFGKNSIQENEDGTQNAEVKKEDSFGQKMADVAKSGAIQVIDALRLTPKADEERSFAEVSKDLMEKAGIYAPDMISHGLLGGGISLLTGAVGGPLLGAGIGAAIGFVKRSEKAQEFLFGKMVNGERQEGGVISPEIQKAVKNYFPEMSKMGIAGGIAGLFTPLGPIGGMLIGSAIGFAKKNESIRSFLFGKEDDEGLISKKTQEFVKKALPHMAVGAIGGLLAGPFGGPMGLVGNLALGAGIGLFSSTDKFKEMIFGQEKDGKRQGGLMGFIREDIIRPIKEDFLPPFKKNLEIWTKGLFEGIKNTLDSIFENTFGISLTKMMKDYIFNPLKKTVGGIFKLLLNPAKFVLSAPSKLLGAWGNSMRMSQIYRGQADYMTAQERIDFREKHKMRGVGAAFRRGMFFGGPTEYRSDDDAIAQMSDETLTDLAEGLRRFGSAGENLKSERRNIINEFGKQMDPVRALKGRKIMKKLIEDLDYDSAIEYIQKQNISDTDKASMIDFIEKNKDRFTNVIASKNKFDEAKSKAVEAFKKYGLHGLDEKNIGSYSKLLDSEVKNRKKNETTIAIEDQSEKQQEYYRNMLEHVADATEVLRAIAEGRPPRKKETSGNATTSEPKSDTDKLKDAGYYKDKSGRWRNNKGWVSKDVVNKAAKELGINIAEDNTNADELSEAQPTSSVQNKKDKKSKKIFGFIPSLGKWISGKQTEDGDIVENESEKENRETRKELDEDRQQQKNISNKLSSIGSFFGGIKDKIFGFFGGGDKNKEKEPWYEKIVRYGGAIFSGATILGALPHIDNFISTKIFPKIGSVYTDHIRPAIDKHFPKLGEMIGAVVDFFGVDEKGRGPLAKIGAWFTETAFPWIGEHFPPFFKDKIIPYYVGGFEYLFREILPTFAKVFIKCLPSIIGGALQGFGEIFKWDLGDIFGKKPKGKVTFKNKNAEKTTIDVGLSEMPNTSGYSEVAAVLGTPTNNHPITINDNSSNTFSSTNSSEKTENQFYADNGVVADAADTVTDNPVSDYINQDQSNDLTYGDNIPTVDTVTDNPYNFEISTNPYDTAVLETSNGTIEMTKDEYLKYSNESDSMHKGETVGGNMAKAMGKAFISGNAGKLSGLSKLKPMKSFGKMAKSKNLLGKGIHATIGVTKTVGKTLGFGVNKAAELGTKAATGNNIVSKGLKNLQTPTAQNSVITKYVSKIGTLIPNFIKNSSVVNAIKSVLKATGKEATEAAAKEVAEKIAQKLGGKFMGKLAGWFAKKALTLTSKIASATASMGTSQVIFAVTGFISGWRNANTMIGVTREATFLEKLLCGIAQGLNEAFCFGLVPISWLIDLLLDDILPILGVKNTKLQDDRAKAESDLIAYRKEMNDETLTLEDLNNKDKWDYKLKKKMGNWWLGEKDKETGERSGGAWGKIKDFFSGNKSDKAIEKSNKEVSDQVNNGSLRSYLEGYSDSDPYDTMNRTLNMPNTLLNTSLTNSMNMNANQFLSISTTLDKDIIKYDKALNKEIEKGDMTSYLKGFKTDVKSGSTSDVFLSNYKTMRRTLGLSTLLINSSLGSANTSLLSPTLTTSTTTTNTPLYLGLRSGRGSNYQVDPSIAGKRFNNPYDTVKQTIGDSGCGPATAAMYMNNSYTTEQMADLAIKGGYKDKNGGVRPEFFKSAFASAGMEAKFIAPTTTKDMINDGTPVILMGQTGKGGKGKGNSPFTPYGHYVIARGMRGSKMLIEDPENMNGLQEYNTSDILKQSSLGIVGTRSGMGFGYSLFGSGRGTVTAEQINAQLGGVLKGKGQSIINACNKYSKEYKVTIDPAVVAAIMMQETGNGTSNAVKNYNNPAGVMDWDNNWKTIRRFATIYEGIDFAVKNLAKLYYSQGLTTIEQIGSKYAPIGAKNDPNNLNKNWIPGVSKFYSQITGTTYTPSIQDSENGGNQSSGSKLGRMFSELASAFASDTSKYLRSVVGDDLIELLTGSKAKASESSIDVGAISEYASSATAANDFFKANMANAPVTSPFGKQRSTGKHSGIDYGVPTDTPIPSTTDGKVIKVGSDSINGNYCTIEDRQGNRHSYCHMVRRPSVSEGDTVKMGDIIGYVGNTGRSTGPHLHYGIRNSSGTAIDPNTYLSEFYKTGAGSRKTAIAIKPPKEEKQQTGKGGTVEDNSLMKSIVEILIKMLDNTNKLEMLEEIVTLLSKSLGIEPSSEKKSGNKTDSKSNNKQEISKLLSNLNKDNSNGSNEQLLKALELLARQ